MPAFIYNWVRFWVLAGCPVCQKLLGYEENDENLKTIFSKDCKIKRILLKRGFNLNLPNYGYGRVWFDIIKRGSQIRSDLALRRYRRPDFYVDLEAKRLIKTVEEYGIEYFRDALFIERVEAVNISHPANQPLAYRYRIRVVPTVMSPFAPHGILRGLSAEEDELEIERLLFTGGSKIQPGQNVTKVI
jgi:hypothetical protein